MYLTNPYFVSFDNNGNAYFIDNYVIRSIKYADSTIRSIGGSGYSGYSGDGGNVKDAYFNTLYSVVVDNNNNIILADYNNHRIRKIDYSTGNITTIAGTGTPGYSGDGGLAINAMLYYPQWLCIDASNNNIYFSSSQSNTIRVISSSTSIITTIAGTGSSGYYGDGLVATSALLYQPNCITIYNNILYVVDTGNNRIRAILLVTKVITTVVGTGATGYSGYLGD